VGWLKVPLESFEVCPTAFALEAVWRNSARERIPLAAAVEITLAQPHTAEGPAT
jgi:hypothetical protein